MYTIYNNEIKITNVLKGGSINDITFNGSSVSLGDPLSVPPNYKDKIFTSVETSMLNTNDLQSEVIPAHFLTKSVPIDFTNLSPNMIHHVINEIIGINIAMDNIFTSGTDTFNDTHTNSNALSNKDKNLEKNLLAYGINFAHDVLLVDEDGNLSEFKEYLKIFNPISASDPDMNRALKYILTGDETNVGVDLNTLGLTGKPTYVAAIKQLINRLKKLKERHSEVINSCIIGFPRIGVKEFNYMRDRLQGGVYDNLNYILNGGAITAVIRTPNISDYFQNQLTYHERRLKNINKSLTQNSKNSIQQVIDKLREHEKKLRDTFENLKNAVNLDETRIDVNLHADKLKSARKQIKKQLTYQNFMTAIMEAVKKAEREKVL